MTDPFAPNYGTWRGAIRLALAHAEVAAGMSGAVRPDPDKVRRLVFVCHGNICRSAYADVLARRAGMAVASFGLSTSSGKSAWPAVQAFAAARGIDMAAHRTTRIEDYEPLPGDYLLGMETRHLRKLTAHPLTAVLPRGLLGTYADPSFPHLHDPYKLDPAYMEACLTRIEGAVDGLIKRYPKCRRN
ncbi:MAG: phosphotyrosine protein phosphatase [Novosphingobium sp.]